MRVLVTDATMIQRLDELRSGTHPEVEWHGCRQNEEAFWELLRVADVFIGSPFTAEMARRSESMRLIQLAGAGTGGVDFSSLPQNVTVANTYNHERSIAEYAVMCMLALSRRLLVADRALRQGSWYAVRHDPDIPLPETLEGKTVSIVGFGHIGQQVALLARLLGMNIMAIKNNPNAQLEQEYGLLFLGGPGDLPRLLQNADFLVVAVPQTPDTENLIDEQALQAMRPTAFIINVARGAIVDEEALYNALSAQRIAGAAIDTWYQYPGEDGQSRPASQPFHELDNVIMTPHTSGETVQTIDGRVRDVADNVSRLYSGQPLRNVVYS